MTRAFVALAPPAPQQAALAGYLAACATVAPGFRWVSAAGAHLTLRFLGSVSDPALEDLRRRLRGVRRPPFEVALGGLGTFGGRRPAVVWLGLAAGQEPAAALAQRVEAEAVAAGLPPEPRPFRAHLTLARARDRGGAQLPELPPPPVIEPWTAGQMVLYESRLVGQGPPLYLPIEAFPLEADRA